MWNNRDTPLAYFFTFRCYGTWLHGDERGSIDRFHNVYNSLRITANPQWQQYNAQIMKHETVELNAKQRAAVEQSVRENCRLREWLLHSISVRTNHVHVVASIGNTKADSALVALEANATKQMRENGCWQFEHSPWAKNGSKKRLWNERHLEQANDYVINGQGGELPNFD